ncbi:MAG: AAA family ATPase [Alsobacter sp.]
MQQQPHIPVVEDQSAVIAFLCDPATHGLPDPPRRFETHGAVVVLAGDTAYKMKRAVRFPFMDFSTLARRKAACEAELAVNGPNAPEIYRDVVPVTRTADGLALGGPGEPVEWLVRMARFDEARTLDVLASQGPLPDTLLARLVEAVVASHARAPLRETADVPAALGRYLDQNQAAFAADPGLFPANEAAELTSRSRAALANIAELLRRRTAAGQVRRCHGDLHLRNIVMLGDRPVLFDAIEFDEDIATCDLLYDLAFLVMDVWERGRRGEANRVLCRYLWATGAESMEGLPALPFFVSLRAALRAKIEAAEAGQDARGRAHAEAAMRYFALAREALRGERPRLVAVGGLSGTGKSTLAAGLAPLLGAPPGAVHWRSDVERKRLMQVAETEKLDASGYTKEASQAVYERLLERARATLRAGRSAIVDAVFARPQEREAVEAIARETGAAFDGLWLQAPTQAVLARIEARREDASDADAAVARSQAGYDCGTLTWPVIDAGGAAHHTLARACDVLGLPCDPDGED